MGMFDRVITTCPNCFGRLEWQSKSGYCNLDEYSIDDVPPEIARDVNNDVTECDHCKRKYKLTLDSPIANVSLSLEEI